MDFNFLDDKIKSALKNVNEKYLYEIRLRIGYPIIINYNDDRKYLGINGILDNKNDAIICNENVVNDIIYNITEGSIYAFNDRIKEGYITTSSGQRVGITGQCVCSDGNIKTIKNITSLSIRIPHEIENCSKDIFSYIVNDENVFNSLIISPPKYGKTTILKDLIKKLDKLNKNILVLDERGEFNLISGENIDKISYCDKYNAFKTTVRSMSPDIIITDELSKKEDFLCALETINDGVKIIASIHGKNIFNVKEKPYFIDGIFERFFVLESKNKCGILENVYDGDFNLL